MEKEFIEISDFVFLHNNENKKAKVIGFFEKIVGRMYNYGVEPGVYEDKNIVKIILEDGKKCFELAENLTLVNQEDYKNRSLKIENNIDNFEIIKIKKTRDLPVTFFYEGDLVSIKQKTFFSDIGFYKDDDVFVVKKINYDLIINKTILEAKAPIYLVSDINFKSLKLNISEHEMILLQRGNIWKYYNKEDIVFPHIVDEIKFFISLGHYKKLRNPKLNSFFWDKGDAIDVIISNLADFILTEGSTHILIRFNDEFFGRKVRRFSLKLVGYIFDDEPVFQKKK